MIRFILLRIDKGLVERDMVRKNGKPSPLAPLPGGEGNIKSPLLAGERNIICPLPQGEKNITLPLQIEERNSGLPLPPGEGRGEGLLSQSERPKECKPQLPQALLTAARELRKNQTDAEVLLWSLLRNCRFLNFKFRRQYPFPPYVLDFYCHTLMLAIEVDGGQHNSDVGREKDTARTEFLTTQGITVLRFWNNVVLKNTAVVLETIYQMIVELSNNEPSPCPLPGGEG